MLIWNHFYNLYNLLKFQISFHSLHTAPWSTKGKWTFILMKWKIDLAYSLLCPKLLRSLFLLMNTIKRNRQGLVTSALFENSTSLPTKILWGVKLTLKLSFIYGHGDGTGAYLTPTEVTDILLLNSTQRESDLVETHDLKIYLLMLL